MGVAGKRQGKVEVKVVRLAGDLPGGVSEALGLRRVGPRVGEGWAGPRWLFSAPGLCG